MPCMRAQPVANNRLHPRSTCKSVVFIWATSLAAATVLRPTHIYLGHISWSNMNLCPIQDYGKSVNGNFEAGDILVRVGHVRFNPKLEDHKLTDTRCVNDYKKLADIVKKLFITSTGKNTMYLNHLLTAMNSYPTNKYDSKEYKAYLANHWALKSYMDRMKQYTTLERGYNCGDSNSRLSFVQATFWNYAWILYAEKSTVLKECIDHKIPPKYGGSKHTNTTVQRLRFYTREQSEGCYGCY
uniref:Uncharacterized protein n=1 Tax=Setaria italica TaxID=4555 RepID=K4A1F8_SETIT